MKNKTAEEILNNEIDNHNSQFPEAFKMGPFSHREINCFTEAMRKYASQFKPVGVSIPSDSEIHKMAFNEQKKAREGYPVEFNIGDWKDGAKLIRDLWLSSQPQEDKWVSGSVPKDGTKIIRWHLVWKIPICVFYNENLSRYKSCVWITGENSNSYPEESFFPDLWQPIPSPPKVADSEEKGVNNG